MGKASSANANVGKDHPVRISLSVSLDINRDKPEDPQPHGDTFATTERADNQGIGFHIDMPDHSE